ncbi:hypothetical protein F3Y22_tig00004072pilonHSYRG00220 [Hibiscus syriacus]|uniref:CCHC-type domain-containing protein n=1 Tax=Hibiscus syriacus TaxID=106335 RepID=A0A6A3CMK8_HIBSY|nr:hypothetical protein F3Y22_tig00004072pilonHSYRG00220 [Hibiscus syriacus]
MSGGAPTIWGRLFAAGIDQELEFFPPAVVEGSRVVKPPKEVFEEGILDWKHALVGQFIGSAPSFSFIQKIVTLLWSKASPIKRGLSYIASVVGKPLHMDSVTAARERLKYARVCVEVLVGSSIHDNIDVVLSDGSVARIRVSIYWMQSSCAHCGRFGHTVRFCPRGMGKGSSSEAIDGTSSSKKHNVHATIQNDLNKVDDATAGNNSAAISVSDGNYLANNSADMVDMVKHAEHQPPVKRGRGRHTKKGRVTSGSKNKFEILSAIDPDNLLEISAADSEKKNREIVPSNLYLTKVLLLRVVRGGTGFCITTVYGSNDSSIRKQLLTQLNSMEAFVGSRAWLIGSDFNAILKADESYAKVNSSTLADISEFQSCVEGLGLFDHPYTASDVEFQALGDSDHCPSLIWLYKEIPTDMPKPFKFFKFWAMYLDFMAIVRESWQTPVNVNLMKSLYLKLKRLKRCLEDLNRNCYNDISGQVRDKMEKLKSLQLANLDTSTAGRNIHAEVETERELKALEEDEMLFYKQKAKVDWIKDGDQGVADPEVKGNNVSTIKELLGYSLSRDTADTLCKDISDVEIKEKGFDSLNCEFVDVILHALGLPDKFISWLWTCFANPRYFITFNGSLVGYFKGARGVRQGDPLSPYNLVLAMNVLSNLLNVATLKGVFGYHPKCKRIGLTHLCFANDLLIFCKGSIDSVMGGLNVPGGLGLQDVGSWNKSCIVQLIRKLLANEGSLWVAWMHSYVIRNVDFWQMEIPTNASWNFKHLLETRHDVAHLFSGQVCDLNTRQVWDDLRATAPKVSWHHLVWFHGRIPKFNIIAWMTMLNRQPTRVRLVQMGLTIETDKCLLYGIVAETRDHLFFECIFAKELWGSILELCGIYRGVSSWDGELAWATRLFKGKSLIVKVLKLAWTGH